MFIVITWLRWCISQGAPEQQGKQHMKMEMEIQICFKELAPTIGAGESESVGQPGGQGSGTGQGWRLSLEVEFLSLL